MIICSCEPVVNFQASKGISVTYLELANPVLMRCSIGGSRGTRTPATCL